MPATYQQLMNEHDQIGAAIDTFLVDLADPTLGPVELAAQLMEIGIVVNAHVESEEAILSGIDHRRLVGPWAASWSHGEEAFACLRRDWIGFLDRWTAGAIEDHRSVFDGQARHVLGRLKDRLHAETRTLYATALQTGAITLR